MIGYFQVKNENGLFTTMLPPFDDSQWSSIIPSTGFVWIGASYVDLNGYVDSIVAKLIFDESVADLQCRVHRADIDISIPAVDFLRFADTKFQHGINCAHSNKHQPANLDFFSLHQAKWPSIMSKNAIRLALHRPAAGEPSLVSTIDQDVLNSVLSKFRDPVASSST